MAVRRLERSQGREEQAASGRTAHFKRYFATFLSLALSVDAAAPIGTNINNFRDNKSMSPKQKAAPSQVDVQAQQQAEKMVAAFKEFMLTADQQKKTEFKAIFDSNHSAAFVKAMTNEFKKQVRNDPTLGPIVGEWKKKNPDFDATAFMAFVDQAYAAAANQNAYDQLRKQYGPDITKGVLDPLVNIYVAPVKESANAAAMMFAGLLSITSEKAMAESAQRLGVEMADLKSLFLAVKPLRLPQARKKKTTSFRLAEYDHHDHRERNHARRNHTCRI